MTTPTPLGFRVGICSEEDDKGMFFVLICPSPTSGMRRLGRRRPARDGAEAVDGPGWAKRSPTPSGLMTLLLLQKQTGVEGSYVVPRGMEEIVNLIKIRYNNMPMFITENGYSSPDVHEQRVNELTNDVKRIEYHAKHLAHLAKSIRGGADVRGYFVCSLMDNLEWFSGYKVRFGLYYVDRKTLARIPKRSAKWLNSRMNMD
ncbi:putative beta-glucosidase [Helianthus debilis subsp. tardiflorus]